MVRRFLTLEEHVAVANILHKMANGSETFEDWEAVRKFQTESDLQLQTSAAMIGRVSSGEIFFEAKFAEEQLEALNSKITQTIGFIDLLNDDMKVSLNMAAAATSLFEAEQAFNRASDQISDEIQETVDRKVIQDPEVGQKKLSDNNLQFSNDRLETVFKKMASLSVPTMTNEPPDISSLKTALTEWQETTKNFIDKLVEQTPKSKTRPPNWRTRYIASYAGKYYKAADGSYPITKDGNPKKRFISAVNDICNLINPKKNWGVRYACKYFVLNLSRDDRDLTPPMI